MNKYKERLGQMSVLAGMKLLEKRIYQDYLFMSKRKRPGKRPGLSLFMKMIILQQQLPRLLLRLLLRLLQHPHLLPLLLLQLDQRLLHPQ